MKTIEKFFQDKYFNAFCDLFGIVFFLNIIWTKGRIGTVLDWGSGVMIALIIGRGIYIYRTGRIKPISRFSKKKNIRLMAGIIVEFILYAIIVKMQIENVFINYVLYGLIVVSTMAWIIYILSDKNKTDS